MNKKVLDELTPRAYEAIFSSGIANKNKEVNDAFVGQIASFGAAVAQGGLLAAVTYFSSAGSSFVDRPKLMQAIFTIIDESGELHKPYCDDSGKIVDPTLLSYVKDISNCKISLREAKERVMNAAVAIKFALKVFSPVKG